MKLKLPIAAKIILSVFVLAIVLEVVAVNRLSSAGSQINQLEAEQAEIALQNQIIENQIAVSASLVDAQDQVKALGFGDINNPLYIQAQVIASVF